jgi:hypothetical protein
MKKNTLLLLITTITLCSCTTFPINSIRTDNSTKAQDGYSYYLPKQLIDINITGKPVIRSNIEKNLKAAKAAIASSKTEKERAKSVIKNLDKLIAGIVSLGNSAVKQIAEKKLEAAKLKIAEDSLASSKKLASDLEAQLLLVQGDQCIRKYEVIVKQLPAFPDPEQHIVLTHLHKSTSSDDYKITTNDKGLLSTSTITRDDKTSEFIIELSGAISGVDALADEQESNNDCRETYKFHTILAPENINDNTKLNALETQANIKISIDSFIKNTEIAEIIIPSSNENDTKEKKIAKCQGLYYRRNLPYTLTVEKVVDEENLPIHTTVMMFPNGPINCLPFKASRFVKTVHDVEFTNGMLTSWHLNRPSEGLELIKIPVKMAKAIVSVPAEIIQLRVNLATEESNLIESQQTQIKALEALRALQESIENGTYQPSEEE